MDDWDERIKKVDRDRVHNTRSVLLMMLAIFFRLRIHRNSVLDKLRVEDSPTSIHMDSHKLQEVLWNLSPIL